eukprot:1161234-Pelagomonas_calceolata.AAC.7
MGTPQKLFALGVQDLVWLKQRRSFKVMDKPTTWNCTIPVKLVKKLHGRLLGTHNRISCNPPC